MTEFKLDKAKIATGFKTPDHYFDEFPQKFSQRLLDEQTKVVPLHSRKSTWLFAVAAVLLLALCIPLFNKLTTESNEFDPLAAENYLAMQTGISDQLVELLDEDDILKITTDIEITTDIDIEDKAVEDFLSTNSELEFYIIN